MWLFRVVLWWFGREQRLCEALIKASIRRNEQTQLQALESEGIDVTAARELLAALDADEAPKAISPPPPPAVTQTPALPSPATKRPPGRPKSVAPGEPFRNGKSAR